MLQLHWTDATCGVALVLGNTLSTSSAWYVVMVALERLSVICFPFKVISDELSFYFSKTVYLQAKHIFILARQRSWLSQYEIKSTNLSQLFTTVTTSFSGLIMSHKKGELFMKSNNINFRLELFNSKLAKITISHSTRILPCLTSTT